jgi:hypothetical protein
VDLLAQAVRERWEPSRLDAELTAHTARREA